MDNYEKYFGTKERACKTLYSLNISCSALFEHSEERFTKEIMTEPIWSHNFNHLIDWSKWLDKEL